VSAHYQLDQSWLESATFGSAEPYSITSSARTRSDGGTVTERFGSLHVDHEFEF
jgi:hypothetical protein